MKGGIDVIDKVVNIVRNRQKLTTLGGRVNVVLLIGGACENADRKSASHGHQYAVMTSI